MKQQTQFAVGDVVWTRTLSGAPIKCTVLEYNEDEGWYLLDSPDHSYAIQRNAWEVAAP